jgi:hypothetical protein
MFWPARGTATDSDLDCRPVPVLVPDRGRSGHRDSHDPGSARGRTGSHYQSPAGPGCPDSASRPADPVADRAGYLPWMDFSLVASRPPGEPIQFPGCKPMRCSDVAGQESGSKVRGFEGSPTKFEGCSRKDRFRARSLSRRSAKRGRESVSEPRRAIGVRPGDARDQRC